MSSTRPDTWMPFYVGDYLRDTGRLSTEQHGAYLLLIFDYWVSGAPNDDDEELAAITRVPIVVWKKMRPKIEPFFQIADGKWTHKRVDHERAVAVELTKQRSEAGKEGAARRWHGHRQMNGKANGKGIAEA